MYRCICIIDCKFLLNIDYCSPWLELMEFGYGYLLSYTVLDVGDVISGELVDQHRFSRLFFLFVGCRRFSLFHFHFTLCFREYVWHLDCKHSLQSKCQTYCGGCFVGWNKGKEGLGLPNFMKLLWVCVYENKQGVDWAQIELLSIPLPMFTTSVHNWNTLYK